MSDTAKQVAAGRRVRPTVASPLPGPQPPLADSGGDGSGTGYVCAILIACSGSDSDILRKASTRIVPAAREAGIALEVLDDPGRRRAESGGVLRTLARGRADKHLLPSTLRSLGARVQNAMIDALPAAPWVAIGGPLNGLSAAARSQREAEEALRIGTKLGVEPTVVLYADLLPWAALAGAPALCERLAGILDPLSTSRRGGVLIQTLMTLYEEDLDQRRTAQRLRLHRHTIGYRISRTEHLLGRSVRSGSDRLLVELAVRAHAWETLSRPSG